MRLVQDSYDSSYWFFSFDQQDENACDALNELLDKNLDHFPLFIELEELLRAYPLNVDILHHCAVCLYQLDSLQSNKQLSYVYEQAAISIALQAIPQSFNWNKSFIDDGHPNNRPFFRAYSTLAFKYEELGKVEEAIQICERIISVSPNDRYGVRYALTHFYYHNEKTKELEKLVEAYPEEDLIKNAKDRYSHPESLPWSSVCH